MYLKTNDLYINMTRTLFFEMKMEFLRKDFKNYLPILIFIAKRYHILDFMNSYAAAKLHGEVHFRTTIFT
jgi:hypothetical protein